MKKIDVDFQDLTEEMIRSLAKAFPHEFAESDVIRLAHIDRDLEDRVKLIIDDALFLVKKSYLDDAMIDKFDRAYFKSLPRNDESCDAEFCEPE